MIMNKLGVIEAARFYIKATGFGMKNLADPFDPFVGKVVGRWRCYYLQNDKKVFVDGK